MKKLFILLSIFIVFCHLPVKAQFFNKLMGIHYQNGYVVLKNGDTLRGKILFNNGYENYQFLEFKDSLKNKATTYQPQEVRFFSIDSLDFYPKKWGNRSVFMCLLLNDSLKVFLYRYYMTSGNRSGTETSYFYEKPSREFLQVFWNQSYPFQLKAAEFFGDCPELSEKIRKGKYTIDDLFLVAKEYNKWLRTRQLPK